MRQPIAAVARAAFVAVVALLATSASATSETDAAAVAAIPNGDNVRVNGHWWGNPLRATPRGVPSLSALTAFGTALQAAGNTWTTALCQADSDGDGFTNGEELGDPSCVWTPGSTPARTKDISHPGLWSSVPTTTAYPGRTQTAAASCAFPSSQPPTVAAERAALTGAVSVPSGLSGVSREAELAKVSEPDADDAYVLNTYGACPYLAAGLKAWHDPATWGGSVPAAGTNVTLPAGTSVRVTACSLPDAGFATLTIPDGSALILDDSPIHLRIKQIIVYGGLYIGGQACPIQSPITVSFVALAAEAVVYNNGLNVFGSGVVDVVGATSVVHWTRLKTTAYSGATFIVLQKPVDWSFGDEIVIATSIWKDTIDDQNEVRRVQHRQTNNATVLQLNAPLVHKHYAGSEYQSEVALLTRSVLFRGGLDADSQSRAYGGHTWGVGPSATYRMVGVRAERMGQQNVMARYPFHMHMMYEGGNNSYIIGCACVSCYYRCYTVHGTNHSRVRRNVAYNSTGHTYYFEDGGEMFNTLEYNIAVKVNILGVPAAGGAQVGETEFSESAAALLPADRTASGYYVSNARNWVRGNAASGGWSGFAFPVFDTALKLSAALTVIPKAQQLLEFTGNTAHSSGHYWGDAGCIYAGGHLRTDSSGVMWYTNGRFSHPTAYPNGTAAWQNITNLRTWLCQKGYSSWGDRADLSNFECHDCTRSAVLFGQSSVVNMIVNGVSENRPYDMVGVYRIGFGFYDVSVQTMIVNITFRNFYRAPNDANWGPSAAIVDLDHSDIYKPWGISAVRNLRYDAVERRIVVRRWIRESGASRMYNFMDWDGSVVNTATCQGQIIGSNIDWWNGYSDCWFEPLWPAWICPRRPGREVVGLDMELYGISSDAGMDIQADTTTNLITQAQRDALYIGNMSYFGSKSNQRLQLTRNHHLATGLSNTAWYMYLTTGVPEYFNIQPVNFPRGAYILLAISLPSDAQIVYVQTKGLWSYTNALNFTAVSTREQVLNGNGTQYAFDGRHLYIKFSDMYSPYPNAFSRAKVDIYSTQSAGGYNGYIYIQLKCPTKNSGGFCTTPADPDPPADLTTDMPTTVCDNITQLTTIPPLCPNETNVQNPAYGTVNCSSYASWMCAASWPKNYCRRSCLPQCVRNAPYPYTCSMDRGCTAEEKPTPVVDWCRELAAGHVLSSGAPLTSDPCWIARCNGTSRSMQRIQLGTNIPCYGEDTYGPLIGAMCSYSSNVCQGTSQGAANVTVSTLTIPGVTAAANSIDLSVWVAAGTVTSVTLWYRLAHDGVASGTNAASRSVAMSLVESQAATYRYTATSAVWGRITGNVTVAVTTSNWGVVYKTLTDLASTAATNPIVTVVSVNSTAVVLQATPVDYVMGVVLEVYTPSTATATAVTSVGAAFGAAPDLIVVPLTSALPSLSAGQVFAVTLSRINGGTQRVTLPCLGVADGTASANPIVDVRPALSYCAARLTNSYSNTWWFAVTPIDSTPIITNVTIQFGTKTTVIPQTQWYTFQGGPGAAMTSTIRVFVTLASGAIEQWNMSVPFPAMGQLLTCVKGSVADPEAPYRSEAPMPMANSGACINNNFALGVAPWTGGVPSSNPSTTTASSGSTTAPGMTTSTTSSVGTTTSSSVTTAAGASPSTAGSTTTPPASSSTIAAPPSTPLVGPTTAAISVPDASSSAVSVSTTSAAVGSTNAMITPSASLTSAPPNTTTSASTANGTAPATTRLPATPSPAATKILVATVRISGSAFGTLLSNATMLAQLTASVRMDLAKLLKISIGSIIITSLRLGSLVVDFTVTSDALADSTTAAISGTINNMSQSASTSNNGTAVTATWLSNTASVYAAAGNDTLAVTSASVVVATTSSPTSGLSTRDCGNTCIGFYAVAAVGCVAVLGVVAGIIVVVRRRGAAVKVDENERPPTAHPTAEFSTDRRAKRSA